jgi:hypothetical protein
MDNVKTTSQCSPKALFVGVTIKFSELLQAYKVAAPWLLTAVLGMFIHFHVTSWAVNFVFGGVGDSGLLEMMTGLLCLLTFMFIGVSLLSDEITLDNPFGLLLMIVASWLFIAAFMIAGFACLAALGVLIYIVLIPAKLFAYGLEWMVLHHWLTLPELDRGRVTLFFYPCLALAWGLYRWLKGIAIECCQMGQSHLMRSE